MMRTLAYIHITKYAIKRSGEQTMLTDVGATASREWLPAALREFVVGSAAPAGKETNWVRARR